MKNFIEELFYGNIDPQARGYKNESHIRKVADKINEIEEQLSTKLNKEEKTLFLEFVNANSELSAESGLDSFIVGFRLGARFVYDTFVSNTAPFYNYIEWNVYFYVPIIMKGGEYY